MKLFKPRTKIINFDDVEGEVKVSTAKPPVWDSVCKTFNVNPTTAIFTYGDTIYNPNNCKLNKHLIEHERVHMKQQNYNDKDAALWWGRFLREPEFRIDQEARAYAHQYDVICEIVKDRNMRARVRMDLSRFFSGPLYGSIITQVDAINLISKYAKTK
jgi:hypothetical protein